MAEKKGKQMAEKKDSSREDALAAAIAHIEKQFGRGALMRLGEASPRIAVEVIPSGSLALDMALRVGGIPRGRVTEVYGAEASGKSTLAQHIVAETQKRNEVAVYIDVEHALDPAYAARCEVNVEELFISQPDSGEQALRIADALVRSQAVGVVVIDSVAALVSEAEVKGEMGEPHVGLQARLMSQALRKLTAYISSSRTAVVFINQVRERIGSFQGNPEVTPGGRALKFYSTVRIRLNRVESIKAGSETVGNRVKAKVVKNKAAPPFGEAEFDIVFGRGIAREGDVLDLGVDVGAVRKSGAFYSSGELRLGHGREAAKAFLRERGDVAAEIERAVRGSAATPGAGGNGHEESEQALVGTVAEAATAQGALDFDGEGWDDGV